VRDFTAWAVLSVLVSASHAAQGPAQETKPTIIKAGTLQFLQMDRDGQDAYVVHRVCIDAEGHVDKFDLLPEGFHQPEHVRAAETYVRTSEFKPGTVDGEPVASCFIFPVWFFMAADSTSNQPRLGVTAEFRRELDKATKLIQAGDIAGAHHHTEYMLREKVKLRYEYLLLQARLADTYVRSGNAHRAIEMAARATARNSKPFPQVRPGDALPENSFSDYLLSEEWITQLLKMRMQLAATNGLLLDSLQAYYELASLTKPAPGSDIAKQGELLEKAFASGGEMKGRITVGERAAWLHPLLRKEFTVEDVKGSVKGMTLVCGSNERTLKYEPDVEWRVPAKWRDCRLSIAAEPGTSLAVVEFAEASGG
jgi:hypothetical protein